MSAELRQARGTGSASESGVDFGPPPAALSSAAEDGGAARMRLWAAAVSARRGATRRAGTAGTREARTDTARGLPPAARTDTARGLPPAARTDTARGLPPAARTDTARGLPPAARAAGAGAGAAERRGDTVDMVPPAALAAGAGAAADRRGDTADMVPPAALAAGAGAAAERRGDTVDMVPPAALAAGEKCETARGGPPPAALVLREKCETPREAPPPAALAVERALDPSPGDGRSPAERASERAKETSAAGADPPPAALAVARLAAARARARNGPTSAVLGRDGALRLTFASPESAAEAPALRRPRELPALPGRAGPFRPEGVARRLGIRLCMIRGCASAVQRGRLCEAHDRLREDGLLRLDEVELRVLCMVRACGGAPVDGLFCAEHGTLWHRGRVELRRRGQRLPFLGYLLRGPEIAARALGVLLVVSAALGIPAALRGREVEALRREEARAAEGPAARRAATSPYAIDTARSGAAGLEQDEEQALLDALHGGSVSTRRRAARALSGARGERAASALVQALSSDDPGTRDEATRALAAWQRRGPPVDILGLTQRRIAEARGDERFQLVVSYGAIGRSKAVDGLRDLHRWAEDEETRRAAIHGLARTGDPTAAETILGELRSDDAARRADACVALGRLGWFGAVEALIERLADADARVREAAHWALCALTGERLDASMEVWRTWWQSGVADAYGQLDQRVAVCDGARGAARAAVLRRLSAIRDPRVVDAARRALHDDDPAVRRAAAATLGGQRAAAALPDLALALRDPVPDARRAAHEALISIVGRDFGTDPDPWLEWWHAEGQ